jgi:hypothetical protein
MSEIEKSITNSDTASETDSETDTETFTISELHSDPISQEVLDEIKRKELITKVKVIAFDSLGKDPLTNGSKLNPYDKTKVINKMEEILTLSENDINTIFNNICTGKIFTIDRDYTEFTVYDN